jgi:hypothetical protein
VTSQTLSSKLLASRRKPDPQTGWKMKGREMDNRLGQSDAVHNGMLVGGR